MSRRDLRPTPGVAVVLAIMLALAAGTAGAVLTGWLPLIVLAVVAWLLAIQLLRIALDARRYTRGQHRRAVADPGGHVSVRR